MKNFLQNKKFSILLIQFNILLILFLILNFNNLNSQTYKNSYNSTVIINSEGENNHNLELRSPSLNESLTFTFPENTGDFDEVLTTDGNGNLIWTSKTSSTLTNDLYFDIFDATGGQDFTTSTITLNFDTERQNPNSSIFTNSTSSFTIYVSDKFLIMYRVGIDVSSGSNRSDFIATLESYDGFTWSEVSGFRTHGYNRQANEGMNTSSAFGVVDITSGDSYRIRVWRDSGSDVLTTIANGSSVFVMAVKNAGSGPAGPPGADGADGAVGEKGDKGDPGTASDYINVYDGIGDEVSISTTTVTVPLNTTRNASGTIFTLEDNNLIIAADDVFMIEYTTTMYQNGGNNRSTWNAWLEEDTGSGFSEIPGTRSAAYSRQNSDGQDNANGKAIVEVNTSSTFRIVAQRVSGSGVFFPLQNATALVAYTLRGGEQGPAGASGTITGAQGEPGEKGDKGDPGTASDFINIYDGVGGQITIDPGPETIPLNTIGNYSGTIFNLSSDNLEINATDTYMFQYSLTLIQTGGNNRSTWRSWLESNTGTGFTEVPGTRSGAYSRQTSDGEDNAFGQAVIEVENSATFRIRAETTNGVAELQPIQNGTSLIVYTLRGGEQGPAGESGTVTIDNSSTITIDSGSGTFIEGEGSINEIAYFSSSTSSRTITSSQNLFWIPANNHLGISNSSPSYNLDVAQDIGIGNSSNSGTLSFTAVNGLDTYRINFTTSASTSENINYVLPSEQGVENSALMNDGGGNLFWGSPSSIASSIRFPIFYTGASDYDCELTDSYIVCDNTGTTIAVNLPPAVDASGKVYFIKKTSPNGAAHTVTVTPDGTDTIDGDPNWELSKVYDAIMLISDGDETWHLMSRINN